MKGKKMEQRLWMEPIDMQDGDKHVQTYPCRGLKLIGIRFYPYVGDDKEEERTARCIQKSLYGKDEWFYFYKGFHIEEQDGTVTQVRVDDDAFDADFMLYHKDGRVDISLSAIVGQNGTGKSTIVDSIVRLVNNLAAAIFGEGYNYTKAQHLHFIDQVYASLAVYIDTEIKILTCKGRHLSVTTLGMQSDPQKQEGEPASQSKETYVRKQEQIVILDGTSSKDRVLTPQLHFKYILEDWFYTLVSNYSLYAYNYRDYLYERTNDTRLEELKKERPEDNKEEDKVWLKGVFHKNDGYQTPVVIHPMREDGYINAIMVNQLGKHNLTALCFEERKYDGIDGISNNRFPFRVINQTHHIVAFKFNEIGDVEYETNFDSYELRQWIKATIEEFWRDTLGINNEMDQKGDADALLHKAAWTYLLYKTQKVLSTYKHYELSWKKVEIDNDKQALKEGLEDLLRDASYRTLKIRQTVAYLRFSSEEDYYVKSGSTVNVDEIYAWMQGKKGSELYPGKDWPLIDCDDVLPPPFLNIELILVDNEHLKSYQKTQDNMYLIPFEGLSSGERQVAYTLGNIAYHLKNIQSGMEDINSNRGHVTMLKYRYVNILLDEVELYFHPDLQRRFVSLLIGMVDDLQLKYLSGINITMVTHSPFVLSDLPDSNILCLSRNPEDKFVDRTFAANIHDLFNNTFILPFTIGEYAQKEIAKFISIYHLIRQEKNSRKDGWNIELEYLLFEFLENKQKMRYLVNIIGDSYLKEELQDMLDELEEIASNNMNADHEED